MKNFLKAVAAAVLVLLLAVPAFAANKVVEPGDDFYYLDTANVLSQETEGEIYFCNQLLYDACGAQIVIAAVDTINGADIYDYTCDMFNSWGIGSADENNGFLLLMAIEEDDYYALPGSGIDGIFSSSVIKKLYDSYLEEDFAAGKYDEGARRFFEAVFEKVSDRYNAGVTVQQGIDRYNAFIAGGSNGNAETVNASSSGGGGGANSEDETGWFESDSKDDFNTLKTIILIVVLLWIFSGKRRGSFLFRNSTFIWPLFNAFSNSQHHSGSSSHHSSSHSSGDSYHSSGSYKPSGSSFRGGGFGGGHGSGGGSFGGGAGRGRH